MNFESTVFALSTPVGGAITVLRISGADSRGVLERVFTGSIADRRVSYGRIVDADGEIIDTCCAVFYAAPNSYTGEDVAELSFHGSFAVAERVLELIGSTGLAVPAEAGEFTKRAYLNGKMDLAEAEAVMDMISASAERSRRAAALQLTGRLSAVIRSKYEEIKLACAELANFLDDDTGEVVLDEAGFKEKLKGTARSIKELADSGMRARVIREGARIAIIGSPNVGKSSLLNALLMRERAIVTPIPGTTRDTLEESASVNGIPVVFIDTAGIRRTADDVERMGIERSLDACERADLILWLVDGTRGLNAEDIGIRERLEGRNVLCVITKSDLNRVIFPDKDGSFYGFDSVLISSVTGAGMTELKDKVARVLVPDEGNTPIITNSRHVKALTDAAGCMERAFDAVGLDPDAAYFELREAMESAASILGILDVREELVDSIFSNFCIGK